MEGIFSNLAGCRISRKRLSSGFWMAFLVFVAKIWSAVTIEMRALHENGFKDSLGSKVLMRGARLERGAVTCWLRAAGCRTATCTTAQGIPDDARRFACSRVD